MVCNLTLCKLGNFACFLSTAEFYKNKLFPKILSGIPPECQTVCKGYQQLILEGKELRL